MHVNGPEEYTVRGSKRKCPYAGRSFAVTLRFPSNYPFKVIITADAVVWHLRTYMLDEVQCYTIQRHVDYCSLT